MRETRAYHRTAPEIRGSATAPVLAGYGAVFNSASQNLGGFVEEVDPSAFTDTLRRVGERNILGAFNHDASILLATTDSDSLSLRTDGTGLGYEMDLDVEDPDAIRVMRKVQTGKVRGSSFTFVTREDEWSTTAEGFPLRRLLNVELYELGPVTSPAYRATEGDGAAVALRSLSQFVDLPFERVSEAARLGQLTTLIRSDLPGDAPDEPDPETPSEPPASAPEQDEGPRNLPTPS